MKIFSNVQRVRILYKTILRLHRGLPEEIQVLGNNYVKDEFRRHKNCNPTEARIFMNEWTNYAISITKQLGIKGPVTAKSLGDDLSAEKLEQMNDDQIQQLYELMIVATGETDKK